jgi:hypothetical protein
MIRPEVQITETRVEGELKALKATLASSVNPEESGLKGP